MKKFLNSKSVVLSVFFIIIALCFGTAVYGAHEKECERRTREIVELSTKVDSLHKSMQNAEEECFWQAKRLYDELCMEEGASKLISGHAKSLMSDGLPNLEYYKAAIAEMSNGIEDYEDRFDDCDYWISLKNAVNAEVSYRIASDRLNYLLNH